METFQTVFGLFQTVFGLLCLATVIYVLHSTNVSDKKAVAEMKQGLGSLSAFPKVSNENAALLARAFFQAHDAKAYRKYGDYVVTDASLPVTVKPATTKSILLGTIFAIGSVWAYFFADASSEGLIWNAIPVPGVVVKFFLLGFTIIFVWMAAHAWLKRDSMLTLERDAMILKMAGDSFRLSYGSYKLLVTPQFQQFTLGLMSGDRKLSRVQGALALFPQEQVVPTLVVKAIEYGNLHSTTGVDVV